MQRLIRPILLPAFLIFGLSADAAIVPVAHKVAKELTGAEQTALATSGYTSNAGNLIVVWAVSYSGFQSIGLVTDSAGDTFVPATTRKGSWWGTWYYAKNVKGDPFNVVTIHPAKTGRATFTYAAMSVIEYSGADKTAPLDLDVAGPQGSLSGGWTSEPFNVSAGELVLIGIATGSGGTYTAAPGYKIEDSYITPTSSKFSFATLDQVFPEAKTGITASVTFTGTFQTTGSVITIKPAK